MSTKTITSAASTVTTWPADHALTEAQQESILRIAEALAQGGDPDGIDYRVYDPASHVAPARLSRPLAVLRSVVVTEDTEPLAHFPDLGELVVIVRLIDCIVPKSDEDGNRIGVAPHADVLRAMEYGYQGVSPKHFAPDDEHTHFTDAGFSLDDEAVKITGIGVNSRRGRGDYGVPLRSGLEAVETVYRVRLSTDTDA